MVFGPEEEVGKCSGANNYSICHDEPTLGQGFYDISGELFGDHNEGVFARLFMNTRNPDGQYTGTETVICVFTGQDDQRKVLSKFKVGYDITLLGPNSVN